MEVLRHEEPFEFPLMKLIEERAEKDDTSILAAAKKVIPEYAEPLRWRDEEYEIEMNQKEIDERAAITEEYNRTHSKRADLNASFFDVGKTWEGDSQEEVKEDE